MEKTHNTNYEKDEFQRLRDLKAPPNSSIKERGDHLLQPFGVCDSNQEDRTKSSLTTESEEWLTSAEVAQYLKISKKTLMNLVSLGKVPRKKFGRLNRYKKSDILLLITDSSERS